MQYTSLGPFLKVLIEKIGEKLENPHVFFFFLKSFVHDSHSQVLFCVCVCVCVCVCM